MKLKIFFCVFLAVMLATANLTIYASVAVALWVFYIIQFLSNASSRLVFKEFILVLYGLNYLWGPVMTYYSSGKFVLYGMKISEEQYFSLAIPAMLCLQIGMNVLKTSIFKANFDTLRLQSFVNESILKTWVIGGLILTIVRGVMPSEVAFVVYLVAGIRYVGAFGLFILNKRKYKWYIIAVFFQQLTDALLQGMFHDMIMWLIFFVILILYLFKPSIIVRCAIAFAGIAVYFILQISKSDYRKEIESGSGGFETFYSVMKNSLEEDDLLNENNYTTTVSRVNQAWIFASTVNNMDRQKNFQQLNLVERYAEAAILPRVLAPNKIRAGDKEIFNEFSGHTIQEGTAMGLGVFADGYIAYGSTGVYLFAFCFGLLIAAVFKVVEDWSKISPFFIFFIFPILNYAVRPDCETQTILGHLIKGLIAFGLMMLYYKKYFSRKIVVLRRLNLKDR